MMSALLGTYRRWSLSSATALAFCLLLAGDAGASQSDFSLQFGSQTPGVTTALHLYIVYRNPADPDGKPSPIRHLVTAAPPGSRFDLALPRCTASDQEIMSEGPSACPANSQVGQGTLTAITGFGPPTDPFPTDVTIFNTGDGVVEVIRDHRTGATLADDRIQIKGNEMIGNPPAVPGGPPDGQTAVRTIDFTFPASTRYITTPPQCAGGAWTSNASFTFADGTTQHISSTAPCTASKGSRRRDFKAPRIRLLGVQRKGCVRRAFRARVRIGERWSGLRRAGLYLDGRRVASVRNKRFSRRIRPHGLRRGRHRVKVVAVDNAANRSTVTASFRRCRR